VLALWAEASSARRRLVGLTVDPGTGLAVDPGTGLVVEVPGIRPGSRADPAAGAPDHPFAVPAPELRELLGSAGAALRWLAGTTATGERVVHLPTGPTGPVPSPELAPGEGPPPGGSAVLAAWRVDVLTVTAEHAAQLLGELFDPYWPGVVVAQRGQHDAELHLGGSLRWLVAVHDLAWRTVRRGAVLPTLVTGQARWRPVPDREAEAERATLAAALSPSLLAGGPVAGLVDLLVDPLVDLLVDVEVRGALDGGPPLLRPGRTAGPGSRTTRAFMQALTSATGELEPTAPEGAVELADLAARLVRWHRSRPGPESGLVLGFRLAEPMTPIPDDPVGLPDEDAWRVEFTARSAVEPALVVDADRLWAGGAALAALARTVPKVEETFLDEFERAVRCWPRLAVALRDGRPDWLHLDRAGALAFLATGAGALTDAGFEVQLPAWWRAALRLGLRMSVRGAAGGPHADPGTVRTRSLLDRDAVVAFDWQVALGRVPLRVEELERLAEAAVPLVRVRGQWVVTDRAGIEAALAFLRRSADGTTTVGEVLDLALAPDAAVAGLPVVDVEASGALGDLLAGFATGAGPGGSAGLEELALPVGFGTAFRATLRPYQLRGVAWLRACERLGLGAVLADDMGLGKTVQTLALLVAERLVAEQSVAGQVLAGHAVGPTLLVCPTSLVGNWEHEAARFAPGLRLHVHHGAGRHAVDVATAAAASDVVVTTVAIAHRDVEQLRAVRWHRLVVDEAHQIKNRAAAQSRAIRSLPARHRLALTGTPVENRLADLHAVLDLTNPGRFGSAEAFKHRWSRRIELHGNAEAAEELRRCIRPLVLRRLKTDPAVITDLPEKLEMTVHCTLTVEQAALYRAVVADVLQRVAAPRAPGDRIERRGIVLASLSKLKQVCNHPAQFLRDGSRIEGRSGKVARLEEILDEVLAAGERALCFTQFAGFGALLQPYLARRLDREVLFLHGGVPRGERERLVERFAADDGPPVFLLSLKAGGTGLNLTAANHVIHLDRWWNPAVEDQATDRAFRIGQRRDVQVRRLVVAGTIEERIDEIVAGKRALADAALTPGEGRLADLDDDALAALLALTAEGTDE